MLASESYTAEGGLMYLGALFRPLPPDEAERRSMLHREAGTITPEMISRALLGEFS